MPSISLTDRLGLDFQIEPNATSAIQKYFKIIPQLLLKEKTIDELKPLTLADPAITSLHIGLDVNQPIPVGTTAVDLAINGGPSAGIDIFVPSTELPPGEADLLFSPDDFGEAVPVQQNERYVSVGFTATLGASIATGVSDLSFGFGASTSLSIVNYQKFTITPTAPLILDAISRTISKFELPGDIEDLETMAPDSIITLSGSGGLKFSATASLAVVSNPLATVDLGSVLPSIQIVRGNSITVGAAFRQSGDFQVRIRKTGPHTVRLGYFKRHTSEVDLSANAQAGISVAIGSEDLFGRVISAISPDAVADMKELKAAQLDPDTISAIQATVKASIDRSLEIALSAEWDSLSSRKAAFLYEVDLTALNAAGRTAIHKALDGDLSDLIQNEDNLPPGIRMIQSIFTNLRQAKHAFKINLLGIYNFISVSKLTSKGQVLFDPASGELTISDSAAATRFQTGALNVGGKPNHADPKQLRKALARYFLITATYRAAGCVVSPPDLKSSYTYFGLHDSTNRETMQDELDLAVGLGLLTETEQQQLIKSVGDFGRTIVYGHTDYNDQLTQTLFLRGDNIPRNLVELENIGRKAMRVAIHNDAVDQFRLKPLENDELWKKMKDIGQPGFGQIEIFKKLNAPQLGAITADYSVIVWWAEAMSNAAQKLAELRAFFKANPNPDLENNTFKKLRAQLANHLRTVAADTKDQFGQPWGMIVMDMLSGGRSEAKVVYTGPVISLTRIRQAVTAGVPS
jgi:hypothetical protein